MTDLQAALAASIKQADSLFSRPASEDLDDVLATRGDTFQRFNAAWRESQRESKEGSP